MGLPSSCERGRYRVEVSQDGAVNVGGRRRVARRRGRVVAPTLLLAAVGGGVTITIIVVVYCASRGTTLPATAHGGSPFPLIN